MIGLVLGTAALFGALLILGLQLAAPRVRQRHLAAEIAGTPRGARARFASIGTQATALAERALERNDRGTVLSERLERAGIDMRAGEFAALAFAAIVAAALVGLVLNGVIVGLLLAVVTVFGFYAFVSMRTRRRRKRFSEQLPDSLQLISGGLRAGHSLPQAIDALAQESEAPTSDEFRRVLFETRLGHPMVEALQALADRLDSEDFEWVVQAIEIQRDVGGDLAELLDNVTRTIRDRNRVQRQIETLTAEGRLSAVVLFCLPLGMLPLMWVLNPEYLTELTSTFAGQLMLVVGGALLVVGGLWLRRIVRLIY